MEFVLLKISLIISSSFSVVNFRLSKKNFFYRYLRYCPQCNLRLLKYELQELELDGIESMQFLLVFHFKKFF